MHLLSETVMLTELKKGGLLKGNVDNMMKVHLAAVFYPHGLGHLVGVDVIDVGAFTNVLFCIKLKILTFKLVFLQLNS